MYFNILILIIISISLAQVSDIQNDQSNQLEMILKAVNQSAKPYRNMRVECIREDIFAQYRTMGSAPKPNNIINSAIQTNLL